MKMLSINEYIGREMDEKIKLLLLFIFENFLPAQISLPPVLTTIFTRWFREL